MKFGLHVRKKTCWRSVFGGSVLLSAGCRAGEAAIDGVYGGIADTVASVVSQLLLTAFGG